MAVTARLLLSNPCNVWIVIKFLQIQRIDWIKNDFTYTYSVTSPMNMNTISIKVITTKMSVEIGFMT